MPEVRYPLSFNVVRHSPPATQDELNRRFGTDSSLRKVIDAGIMLCLHVQHERIVQLDVVPVEGMSEPDRERPWCPGGEIKPSLLFEAWIRFGEALLDVPIGDAPAQLIGAVVRTFNEARRDARIKAQLDSGPTYPITGAPPWLVGQGEGFHVQIGDAWGEQLGFNIEERIALMPLGSKMEWQAYLQGWTLELSEQLVKARPQGKGPHAKPIEVVAVRVAEIVRAKVKRAIVDKSHPAIPEVADAQR